MVWSAFVRGQAGMTWSRPWALYALVRWASANGLACAVPAELDAAEAIAR
jgi:hypothetical protein